MGAIFDLFKKHGMIPKDATAEQLAALETDFDAVESTLKKAPSAPAAPPAARKDGDPPAPPAVLSAEVQAQIDALAAGNKKLGDELAKVVSFVTDQNRQTTDAQKAALQKRYTDHVEKLATEGRITKQQKDDYLKPETIDKNTAAIEVFEQTTSLLPVQAALAPKGQPGNQNQQPPAVKTATAHDERRALEQAALDEIAASMKN